MGQFSFWGNYLPRVYPIHFAGPVKALLRTLADVSSAPASPRSRLTLAITSDPAYAPTKIALVAAAVGFSVYLVGLHCFLLAA